MPSIDRRSELKEKQRVRSKVNRDTRKTDGRPSHNDPARALLDIALVRYLLQGREDHLMRLVDQVARRLEEVGFAHELTEQVWLSLQDSYAAGRRTLLRQRRTIAKREAGGSDSRAS